MSMQPTWRPMPDELQDLKPPTREDAINYMQRGWNRLQPWEETTRAKQCEQGMYGGPTGEMCREYRRVFDEQREGAIADAMIGCQREYERKVAEKARIEADNAEVLAAETATLRQRFLEQPGATPEEFEKALPELLAERRRRAALDGQTLVERMADEMRPHISL